MSRPACLGALHAACGVRACAAGCPPVSQHHTRDTGIAWTRLHTSRIERCFIRLCCRLPLYACLPVRSEGDARNPGPKHGPAGGFKGSRAGQGLGWMFLCALSAVQRGSVPVWLQPGVHAAAAAPRPRSAALLLSSGEACSFAEPPDAWFLTAARRVVWMVSRLWAPTTNHAGLQPLARPCSGALRSWRTADHPIAPIAYSPREP